MSKIGKMTANSQRRPTGYDIAMIRDFIQHLLWELRIAHHELTHPEEAFSHTQRAGLALDDGTILPVNFADIRDELTEQLIPFMKKYGPVGLVPMNAIRSESEEEARRAAAIVRKVRADERLAAIAHLEALEDVLEQAFEMQERGRQLVIEHDARTLIALAEQLDL